MPKTDDVFMIQVDFGEAEPFIVGVFHLPEGMPLDESIEQSIENLWGEWRDSAEDRGAMDQFAEDQGAMDQFVTFLETRGFKQVDFNIIPVTVEG